MLEGPQGPEDEDAGEAPEVAGTGAVDLAAASLWATALDGIDCDLFDKWTPSCCWDLGAGPTPAHHVHLGRGLAQAGGIGTVQVGCMRGLTRCLDCCGTCV